MTLLVELVWPLQEALAGLPKQGQAEPLKQAQEALWEALVEPRPEVLRLAELQREALVGRSLGLVELPKVDREAALGWAGLAPEERAVLEARVALLAAPAASVVREALAAASPVLEAVREALVVAPTNVWAS